MAEGREGVGLGRRISGKGIPLPNGEGSGDGHSPPPENCGVNCFLKSALYFKLENLTSVTSFILH